jgi:receptor expression-enhancing protein 5/6
MPLEVFGLDEEQSTLLFHVGMAIVGLLATIGLRYVPPTRGVGKVGMVSHVVFAVCAVLLCLAPEKLSDLLFSEYGYAIVGVVFPVMESVRAAASVGENKGRDDTRWLTYWIAAGSMWFLTEWLDSLRDAYPNSFGEFYWQSAVIMLMWLQLPFTDGASLMYDKVTKRVAVPLLAPYVGKFGDGSVVGSVLKMVGVSISIGHVMFLYTLFIILPNSAERFIVVAIGTAYPVAASIVAVTTEATLDDTQWLVYWVCFATMYLLMLVSEDILAWIPGYHSLALTFVCYLMLPMFQGAEVIFRGVLVPLFGLKATLLKRDARVLAQDATRGLTPKQRDLVVDAFHGEIEAHKKKAA